MTKFPKSLNARSTGVSPAVPEKAPGPEGLEALVKSKIHEAMERNVFMGARGLTEGMATTEPPGDLPPIEFGNPANQEYVYKHKDPYYDLKNPVMGIIIGAMFGGAFFLCILCWICRWCRRCRHRRKKKKLRKKTEKMRQKREAEKRMHAIRDMEDQMLQQAQGDERFQKGGKKDKKKKKGIKLG